MELRPYQIDTLAFHIAHPNSLDRSEPATGKTAPACVMFKFVSESEGGSGIFVMPKSLLVKNDEEVTQWTGLSTLIYKGKPTLTKWRGEFYDVILTTADTLAAHYENIRKMLRQPLKIIVADETHLYWSTYTSKRTAFVMGLCRLIPRNIWMTGTVIRGRLDSVFPIIHMIDPRYYGNHGSFMNQHGVYEPITGEILGWKNEEKINTILKHHSRNVLFKDVYGDANLVYIPTHVGISDKHKKAYKEFEEFANLELDDESILMATEAGVHTIRCRQLLACPETLGVKVDNYGKDDWLVENILTGQYNKIVLFSALHGEQNRMVKICEDLGFKVGLINGTVSGDKRGKIDEAFRNGDLQVIVASPLTAGVGLNWHVAEVAAFVSTDYMDDSFIQATFRFIRGVRETTIPIYLLRYVDTIEDKIYGIIQRKSELAQRVDPTRLALRGLF